MLVGETAARYITMSAIVVSYVLVAYLVFVPRFLKPLMLLVAPPCKPARAAVQRPSRPRTEGPPPGYPIWPRWYSTVCFVRNRVFSNYFVLGLIANTMFRTALPGIWA